MAVDPNAIVMIAPAGASRDRWAKPLQLGGMRVTFTSNINDINNLLMSIKPKVLLHDWETVEKTQSQTMHQKLCRNKDCSNVIRIVLVDKVTDEIKALANDTRIHRVITYATSIINLLDEIKNAILADQGIDELQKRIREMTEISGEYDQQDVDKAVEDAYQKFSHDPIVKLEYGGLNYRRNKFDTARELSYELLKKDKNNIRAINLLSRVYMKTGENDKAIELLERANSLCPFNPGRLADLGDAYHDKGDLKKAGSYYSQALKEDPKNKAAREKLGNIAVEEAGDDPDAALDLFRDSVSEDDAVSFFNNAAVQAARKGDLDKALRLYEQALKVLKTDKYKPMVLFNLGMAHRRIKNHPMALKHFKDCIAIKPDYQKAKDQIKDVEKFIAKYQK